MQEDDRPLARGQLLRPPEPLAPPALQHRAGSQPLPDLHPARHIEPDYDGSVIPYAQEDPWVRETFEAELVKRGLKSQMPPRIYTDPTFNWDAPGDE